MATVLIVEDEVLIADLIADALSEAGFQVVTAHNADEAYARLSPEPRSFSALVTDVNLEHGGDGFDVARRARELNPAIQVAYMTGRPENLARFEPDRALMFAKPFSPSEMVEQLLMLVPTA